LFLREQGEDMQDIARYDAVADFYEGFAPDNYTSPVISALLQLSGDVANLRLLDLACGHGPLTRELARRGAHVVGLDLSGALIAKARAREEAEPLGITYLHADAAAPDVLTGETFDGVTCSFALLDIDNLEGAVANVARLLRPGGFFAFSLLHPCFPGWPSKQARSSWQPGKSYYDEGWWLADGPANGIRPRVGANHRMLSTYLNTLARHDLLLDAMLEPPPDTSWLAEPPSSGAVPVFLVGRCRRLAD
jgi:SAM-dependent methyltransferase